jgi:chemotaxis methyl-accepting protein methylase
MRACGVHSYADYHALLDRTPGEYERLRDALTINVTRFFRNPETWSLVRRS